ncbi:hypothetical protein [Paenibacillus agricola]|uniref:Flagellar hook-length control protein FliK n=1 Tax=Paenibacillus agricola TaxID=2716264 RepID=A0ABX0IWV6_9BACL|nr:hypothetical protein [Paenibacillus agricola]NHN28402.1 hypothetical protein [Paenibacillus agricola]
MNISGLIRSVMGDAQASEPKTLELKTGEVVKGMVVQLLPENEAVVNIGGIQVRAKLETPLKQGEVTLLQVQPDNNSGQVVLKPLGASGVQIADSSLADVLKNVGLPDTSSNRLLVQTLHQSGVALTKENLQAFAQVQAQIPASVSQGDWLSSAVVAFQKGIPLTTETVSALRQAINGPPFHQTLQDLDVQMTKLLSEQSSLSSTTKSAMDTFKSVVALVREASASLVPLASSQLSEGEINNLLTVTKAAVGQGTASQAVAVNGKAVTVDNRPGANMAVTMNPGSPGNLLQPNTEQQQLTSSRETVVNGNPAASTPTTAPAAAPLLSSALATSAIAGAGTANTLQASGALANAANAAIADSASAQLSKPGPGQASPQPSQASSPLASANSPTATAGSMLTATQAQQQPTAANPLAAAVSNSGLSQGANHVAASNSTNKPTADSAVLGKQASDAVIRTDAATNTTSTKEASPVALVNSAPSEEEHWISKLIKAVGIEHENTIFKLPEKIVMDGQLQPRGLLLNQDTLAPNSTLQEQMKSVDTLKGALLMLIQSDDTPAGLKETAQQAIQQITGQQLLLNIDRTSMFTNITMFIPIINANGEQTAAIHIQSRKGERGEIDAKNCRLVFDLSMKALGNTMVDVQVVDRIVSLRVLNDQPFIEHLLESHREEIAAGLSAVGYQFISLKCSPYPEKGQPTEESASGGHKQDASQAANQMQSMYGSKPYKGMDLRV